MEFGVVLMMQDLNEGCPGFDRNCHLVTAEYSVAFPNGNADLRKVRVDVFGQLLIEAFLLHSGIFLAYFVCWVHC